MYLIQFSILKEYIHFYYKMSNDEAWECMNNTVPRWMVDVLPLKLIFAGSKYVILESDKKYIPFFPSKEGSTRNHRQE